MFYSSKIFSKIGWDPRTGSALVGFVNMISTFAAILLLGSKNILRKPFRVWKKDNALDPELCDGWRFDWPWYMLLLS